MSIRVLELRDLAQEEPDCVMRRNADLLHLGRCVYHFAGSNFKWVRMSSVPEGDQPGDLWLALTFQGQPVMLRVSQAWAQALAGGVGLDICTLDDDLLNVLCLSRLVPHLPRGLIWLGVSRSRSDLLAWSVWTQEVSWHDFGVWIAHDPLTEEPGTWQVQIWGQPDMALYALWHAFDPYVAHRPPTPLSESPWALPLVAARWSVDALELTDLAVGDVLLIG
jgi:hypothetical protein